MTKHPSYRARDQPESGSASQHRKEKIMHKFEKRDAKSRTLVILAVVGLAAALTLGIFTAVRMLRKPPASKDDPKTGIVYDDAAIEGGWDNLSPEEIAEKRKKKAPAYRLMVPDEEITFTDGCMGTHTENLLRDCGDFYLRRADGVFAYQLAVVVDDARMGVTEVVRGADLLSSTARQLYLYRLLGLQPPRFAHCPLLLAPDGRRLSKRDGDQSLENLRTKYTAQEIVGKLAYAYGLQPEPAPRTPESLIKDFSWAKVPKQDVCLPEDLF